MKNLSGNHKSTIGNDAMLTAIRIGNFKAFAETQHIPIRPLTLIYGANSAGKSSIIHSLILAHHILETGDFDASLTKIGGGSVDLGGFKQFVHSRNTDLKVDLEWEVSSHGFSERLSKLLPGVNKATIGVNIGLSGIDHALLEQVGELTPREILQVFIDSAREKGDQTQVEKLESSLKESEDQLTIEELTKLKSKLRVEKCWMELVMITSLQRSMCQQTGYSEKMSVKMMF